MPAHNPVILSQGFRNVPPVVERGLEAYDKWHDHRADCRKCRNGTECQEATELYRVYVRRRKSGLERLKKDGVL